MQVLDVFPSDIYALVQIMLTKSVVYSDEVPTAAMTNDGRIILNKEWLEKNVNNIFELCTILYHELLHAVFKHLTTTIQDRLSPFDERLSAVNGGDHIKNIVLDLQILMIKKMVLPEKYLTLFTRLYPESSIDKDGNFNPHFLLNLNPKIKKRMDKIAYKAIHSPLGISIERTTEYILSRLESNNDDNDVRSQEGAENVCGDFGKPQAPEVYSSEAEVVAEETLKVIGPKIRKSEREQKLKKTKKGGRKISAEEQMTTIFGKVAGSELGAFDLLKESTVVIAEKKKAERAIKDYAEMDPKAAVLKAFRSLFVPKILGKTAKFRLGKQERKLWVNNIIPTKFENPVKPEDMGFVQIYLDTSGSQYHILPKISSILSHLSDFIAPNVVAFDTNIYSVNRNKLNSLRMNGGTSFNGVAAHMTGYFVEEKSGDIVVTNERKSKKVHGAVVFTDGYAELDDKWVNAVKKANIKVLVVYTESIYDNSDINKIAAEVKELRLLKE